LIKNRCSSKTEKVRYDQAPGFRRGST